MGLFDVDGAAIELLDVPIRLREGLMLSDCRLILFCQSGMLIEEGKQTDLCLKRVNNREGSKN